MLIKSMNNKDTKSVGICEREREREREREEREREVDYKCHQSKKNIWSILNIKPVYPQGT